MDKAADADCGVNLYDLMSNVLVLLYIVYGGYMAVKAIA